jgi:hypothetical protein
MAEITLRLTIPEPVPGVLYSRCDAKNITSAHARTSDGPFSMDIPVTLKDGKLTGTFVRREGPARRFVYLSIGQGAGDCLSEWSRRAKIDVHDIPAELLTDGAILQVTLPGKAKDGTPACATVRPLAPWKAV